MPVPRLRTPLRRSRLVAISAAPLLVTCAVLGATPAAWAAPTTTSDVAAHHAVTVTLSTQMRRQGDVVTSVLLQGPDPVTGRPGWSRCVDLPQSGLPVWTSLQVRLAYPATYTTSAYSDFACSNGYDYRWSTGPISTRLQHWVVYTFRSPKITLR
ncbi:hypothetical protein [Curtobacterium sp. VKM Ac-2922]|uniref:hypothetical protein n=1 Tax=Curtobacterium sp. VKM Ac-2922 TaxID=2929475 RepID=UPI001FB40021|nr:hypothetical protein [Curtobacterium sp. VKM Ac-2922]MCJ1714759.1 hypothetical protein [Curtobacterium sp. VKM Ac-2922]